MVRSNLAPSKKYGIRTRDSSLTPFPGSEIVFQLQPTRRDSSSSTTTNPLPRESISSRRFRVDFESILSRDSKTTQNRLENDRKTTRNRLPGRGVGGGRGMNPGGWAVAEKQFHYPTGAEIPKIGKRGFRGQKTPISSRPRKGRFQGHHKENGDFWTESALFWGDRKWEFFDPETLFSGF